MIRFKTRAVSLILCTVVLSILSPRYVSAQNQYWAFESIVSGFRPAGAITSERMPRACYSSGSTLRFCYRDEEGWHHELIQSTVMGGASTRSVSIDNSDRFHVVYYGYDITLMNPWIRYRYRDNQGWHMHTVDNYVFYSGAPTLCLDEGMNPHITYSAGALYYWHLGASGAETEVVDSGITFNAAIDAFYGSSIAICYENADAGELRYTVKGPLGWEYEVVDADDVSISDCRLLHDSAGNPHVVFHDETGQSLRYATKESGDWTIETVDDSGIVGQGCSFALDTFGNPHISYYDATNGDLKYAYNYGRGWQIAFIDTVGDVGKSTTIRLDEFGNVYFFYHDVTHNKIKYAYPALSMSSSIQNGSQTLSWSPVGGVNEFWFYGAENDSHFPVETVWPFNNRLYVFDSSVISYTTNTGINDPASNWTYLIIAVDDQYQEIARSDRVGEWDWGMGIP